MKNKILGWIGVLWGGLVIFNGVVRIVTGNMGSGAYAVGQLIALLIGGWMFYAGFSTLKKSKQ